MKVPRFQSLDIVRGIIIILMVFDHARDFFYIHADINPEDLSKTFPELFFSRWITHICAPGFALLAGIAIYLKAQKMNNSSGMFSYLVIRGLVLILLEITVIRFAWRFAIDYSSIGALVIWALGWSMLLMTLVVKIPVKIVFWISIAIIFLHNLLDGIKIDNGSMADLFWALLHVKKEVPLTPDFKVNVLYPILPLFGIMMLGYSLGPWYKSFTPEKRKRNLYLFSIGALLLFVIIRAVNIYGDPSPWTAQGNFLWSMMSFLNVTKYPFSLDYSLITLSILFLLLAVTENIQLASNNFLLVFGREPLFFYTLHLFVLHAMAIISGLILFHDQLDHIIAGNWHHLAADYGFPLWGVVLFWILALLLLYPLVRGYHRLKKSVSENSILHLF